MGFFSDFSKKHLQYPEPQWDLVDDNPLHMVWVSPEHGGKIEMIPMGKGDTNAYILTMYIDNKYIRQYLPYEAAMKTIATFKENYLPLMARSLSRKKKVTNPKSKRKPFKRCKCKVKNG